jgi:predicted phage terminase large subunit-like protein
MEHSEKVNSEKQRIKTHNYFFEDVCKIGNEKTNIEVVGTILHTQSLLAGLLKNPLYRGNKYKSIITWPSRMDLWKQWEDIYMDLQADDRQILADKFYEEHRADMDQDATVFWPDKEPLYLLMKEILEIGKRAFFKEKQNEPLGADDRVFENIWWYKEVKEGIKIERTGEIIRRELYVNNAYAALDPSAGQTRPSKNKEPDFACLATGYVDQKSRIFVHEDWTKRKPPTQQIESIFDHHDKYDYQKVAVETNLFRNLMIPNILAEKKRRESKAGKIIRVPFYDVENTENKEKRIYALEPKVAHGWILFNRSLSAEFINQFEGYPHTDHDDCPDAVEMLYNLIHGRYKASSLSIDAQAGR